MSRRNLRTLAGWLFAGAVVLLFLYATVVLPALIFAPESF